MGKLGTLVKYLGPMVVGAELAPFCFPTWHLADMVKNKTVLAGQVRAKYFHWIDYLAKFDKFDE